MKSVIVTGGAGYIGSHVCKALKEKGFTPIVIDNLVQGHRRAVQWGPFVLGDILDKNLLKSVFREFSPLGVIHLASHTSVRESLLLPNKYYRNNLLGTLTLLETIIEEKITSLIFSSSAAVYGSPQKMPIKESFSTNPLNPYGSSKLMAEKMIDDTAKTYNLSYACLRYFNAAGADPDGLIGESHDPETHLIPNALLSLIKKKQHLSIYGCDHKSPDGTAIRDYIHVTDLARAHVKALDYLLETPKAHLTLNIGTGTGYSVKEIIDTIENITSLSLSTQLMPRISEEPALLVADAKKASLLLNWETRYSDLKTIIETAWAWHKHSA